MTLPIYFINLASRPDRREFMEQQLSALGLTARRIEAVTPADLSQADLDEFCNPDRDPSLSPTTFGCSLSHLAALAAIESGTASYGVVLEDDVILSKRLPHFLDALEHSSQSAGLIRIETSLRGIRTKKAETVLAGIGIVRPYSWEAGSAGYVVSRRGAAAILKSALALKRRQPDLVLFQPFSALARATTLRQTSPALCMQTHHIEEASLGSDMRGPYRERLTTPTLLERVRHEASELWRREIAVGLPQTWHQLLGAKKRAIPLAD